VSAAAAVATTIPIATVSISAATPIATVALIATIPGAAIIAAIPLVLAAIVILRHGRKRKNCREYRQRQRSEVHFSSW
jgi:hypothetical protein